MMVTVSVLGVLAAIAAPSFNNAILGNKLAAFANDFVGAAQLARSEAIKRNAVVHLCRSTDGASCAGSGTFQQGWIVFHDANDDGVVDSGERVVQTQKPISTDFHFTSNLYSLKFQPTGAGATPAALTICRAWPSAGSQERTIQLSATGRASVTTTRTGTCA